MGNGEFIGFTYRRYDKKAATRSALGKGLFDAPPPAGGGGA